MITIRLKFSEISIHWKMYKPFMDAIPQWIIWLDFKFFHTPSSPLSLNIVPFSVEEFSGFCSEAKCHQAGILLGYGMVLWPGIFQLFCRQPHSWLYWFWLQSSWLLYRYADHGVGTCPGPWWKGWLSPSVKSFHVQILSFCFLYYCISLRWCHLQLIH